MAKKIKEQEQSSKKSIQEKIIQQLSQEFNHLESSLGKKEFAKRLKKSAKLITQGVKLKETKKEKPVAATKPAVEVKPVVAAKPKATPKKAQAAPKKQKAAAKKTKPKTAA